MSFKIFNKILRQSVQLYLSESNLASITLTKSGGNDISLTKHLHVVVTSAHEIITVSI